MTQKRLTIEDVKNILIKSNSFLNDRILNVLYDKFKYKTIYCMYMLPDDEDLYQVLIDGTWVVDFEVNRETNVFLFTSQVDIDSYMKCIDDQREKEFFRLASNIGRIS